MEGILVDLSLTNAIFAVNGLDSETIFALLRPIERLLDVEILFFETMKPSDLTAIHFFSCGHVVCDRGHLLESGRLDELLNDRFGSLYR